MNERRVRNRPKQQGRTPNARHVGLRVGRTTLDRRVNTVVDGTIDMNADLTIINRGRAERQGDEYTVRGRVYRIDGDGHTTPVRGPGMYRLNRAEFQTLGVYNDLGLTADAERTLDFARVSDAVRAEARRVWHALRNVR